MARRKVTIEEALRTLMDYHSRNLRDHAPSHAQTSAMECLRGLENDTPVRVLIASGSMAASCVDGFIHQFSILVRQTSDGVVVEKDSPFPQSAKDDTELAELRKIAGLD